ncbi:MAG: hypothetical protein ACYCRD_04415 [Leptospirillum sp.]
MNTLVSTFNRMLLRIVIFPLSRLSIALFLAVTGLFSVPCYAGGAEDEKYGLSQSPGKVFGGIVVHLQKMASTGDDRILIDLTPMTSNGVPVCQKPSGKLVSVLAGKSFRHHREPSSFVVIPDPSDPLPRHLAVGDCLTVDGNDVDRIAPSRPSAGNRIRIVPSLSARDKGIRVVRALSLKLWLRDGRKTRSSDRSETGRDKYVGYDSQKWINFYFFVNNPWVFNM